MINSVSFFSNYHMIDLLKNTALVTIQWTVIEWLCFKKVHPFIPNTDKINKELKRSLWAIDAHTCSFIKMQKGWRKIVGTHLDNIQNHRLFECLRKPHCPFFPCMWYINTLWGNTANNFCSRFIRWPLSNKFTGFY